MSPNHNLDQNQEKELGSPLQKGEPVFLIIGKLRRPHGLGGEMLMDILTDFPERLRKNKQVYVGENHEPLRVSGIRGHESALLVAFDGVNLEKAGEYRNQYVYVKAQELPKLPEGRYYFHQLLGMSVLDEYNNHLGELSEILETGANQVYVVAIPGGKELLLPAIESVVLEINLEQKTITVRPPLTV